MPAALRRRAARPSRPLPIAAAVAFMLLLTVSAVANVPPVERRVPCDEGMRLAAELRFDEARAALIDCLDLNGEAMGPLIALTMMALEEDLNAEAADWSDRAVAAFPDSAESQYWSGRVAVAIGDSAGAHDIWASTLALDAEHAPTLRSLAALLLERGEEQGAYGLLMQLVRVGSGDPYTMRTLSHLARKRALWRQALAHWDLAMQMSEPDASDLRHGGELAILVGDTTYALTSARRALSLDDGPLSWSLMGEALFSAHRFDEAAPAFEEALARDPSMTRARFNLANAYELLGRWEEAETAFELYVEQEPDDPDGHLNLAVHHEKRGRTAVALRHAERAAEIAPGAAAPARLRAHLLEKLGDDETLAAHLDHMRAKGLADELELEVWHRRVADRMAETAGRRGQVQLQHIVTPDSIAVRLVQEDLLDGVDFGVIATRYSVGPTAGEGGDIGWIDPDDMVEDLRRAIAALDVQDVTPPVAAEGLYHFFKRLR